MNSAEISDCPGGSHNGGAKRYLFLRSIGFGGMKAVLLVHDSRTGRDAAMALMPDFRERSASDIESFVCESKITARLEHPNIVPVYDLGTDESGSPYFIMRYLKGRTLDAVLRELRRGTPKALAAYELSDLIHIFIRVCNAVEFAHSQAVLHLDLKPGNIHIGDFGEVQLIDWGLARKIGENCPGDKRHILKGTPGYIAPELIGDNPPAPTPQADVYALGGILFAMLTFTRPAFGLNVQDSIRSTVLGRSVYSKTFRNRFRAIPRPLRAVCQKAMALDPAKRYKNVGELRSEIRAYQSGMPTMAEHASAMRRGWLFAKRWKFPGTLIAAGVLLVLLLHAYGVHFEEEFQKIIKLIASLI